MRSVSSTEKLFLKWSYYFTSPTAMYEHSSCSTASPAFATIGNCFQSFEPVCSSGSLSFFQKNWFSLSRLLFYTLTKNCIFKKKTASSNSLFCSEFYRIYALRKITLNPSTFFLFFLFLVLQPDCRSNSYFTRNKLIWLGRASKLTEGESPTLEQHSYLPGISHVDSGVCVVCFKGRTALFQKGKAPTN